MSSINISLKKEAYHFLKSLKTRDKSFSDVILSFKKEKSDIMRFFGALKDIDWAEREENMKQIEENMKQMRGSFSRRLT